MLSAHDMAGVAVSNSQDELREALPSMKTLYLSSNAFAAGVLEGAKRHDFWP
jgi:hypothetical protein